MSSSAGRGGGGRGPPQQQRGRGGGGGRGPPQQHRGGGDTGAGGRGPPQQYRGGGGGGRGGGDGGRGPPQQYQQPPVQLQSISEVGSSSSSSMPPPQSQSQAQSLATEIATKLTIQPKTETLTLPPASSKALAFPARPGFGSLGKKCMVRANHFVVSLQHKDMHHYDVAITPEVPSKALNRAVMKQLVTLYGDSHLASLKPAYDGRKSLYTAGALPFVSKDFEVKLPEKDEKPSMPKRERVFKIAIKLVARVDLHHLNQFLARKQRDCPQDVIMILDIVLREAPSNRYSVVGRSFFHPTLGTKVDVGDGLECWRGYYQSLRPTQMGMSLNIDVAATAFVESIPLVDYVIKLLNLRDTQRPLTDVQCVKVKRALRNLRVEQTHRKKRCKISAITKEPVGRLMFTVDDSSKRISVAQYFSERYGLKLRFAHWPAVQVGSTDKPSYLPLEVCKIVEGQRYAKKLNEKQVTNMLRASCQRPSAREKSISELALHNDYGNDEYAKQFGIAVDPRLVTIPGARVLPPPMIKYHDTGREVRIQPQVGAWNMINTKMINGGRVNRWACLNFSSLHDETATFFAMDLAAMCASKGMDFNQKPMVPIRSARSDQIERALCDLHCQVQGLELLIIILPDYSGMYGTIKRVCETELGIISQCCLPKNAQKGNKQYLENVALKINVKAGGRNNVLMDALLRKIPIVSQSPTIIFGADVTHPSPGEDSSPSIAAVVASMDWPEVTKYRALVAAQPQRKELIEGLYNADDIKSGMVRKLLIEFKISTGMKPERIIFYRDGVGEHQFNQVLLYELDAIRKACASLEEGYLPPVTFVVVQKRHHTRLFPGNHGDHNNIDRSGNILPGTVVDTQICHPSEFDFYLCSHAGIQGTSRPTHYHVLWDENRFTADAMQTLTNNLCYTYARCTRSVSVVPPAYYAHLAAFRARYYIEGDVHGSGTSPETRGGAGAVRALPTIKDNVKNVMFFC